jgi:hypothetical protein
MMGFARAISFFFHPIIILFPVPFILLSKFNQDYSYVLKWGIFSYVFVLVVALFVLAGVIFGLFSNFNVSRKEQRPLLILFSTIIAFCYVLVLVIFNGPKILFAAIVAIIFGLAVYAVINKWIKASIHVAITTSVLLLTGIAYGKYFFLLFAFLPLLIWSRIKVKEHTLKETIAGSILGIVITLTVYLISKQFFLGIIK